MNPFAFKITTHPTQTSSLGKPSDGKSMEAVMDTPGPVEISTVDADWRADLSGSLNLKHPKSIEAGFKDKKEPIKIFAHVVRHPTQGVFLIDTGVSRTFVKKPAEVGVGWVLRKFFGIEEMKAHTSTAEIIKAEKTALKGVFLTHLHLDHVSGLPDVPKNTPLYVGPKEADSAIVMNVVAQGTNDRLLEGRPPLQELKIPKDSSGTFEGVLDVFGDQSFFAIHSPGHTSGHLAFVARSPTGPILLTGDVCHTRWGWENSVEPGTYMMDREPSIKSLLALKALVKRHPALTVKLGHQD